MIRTDVLFRAGLVVLAGLLGGCSLWPWDGEREAEERAGRERPTIEVDIEGVDGRLADNVRAYLSVARKPCNAARSYVRLLTRRADEEARDALRALGYYHAAVTARVEQSESCPRAVVTVTPGERTELGDVSISFLGAAAQDKEFRKHTARHGLASGDGLDHGEYRAAKQLIERVALERGYLDGRFTRSTLKVDVDQRLATVDLAYDSGPRYSIGEVRIRQEPVVVEEALVRRFLDYTPGEPYTSGVVSRFHSALSSSEYFSVVEVRPLISAPEQHTIPIEIELGPGKKHKFSTGAGLSTDEGVRGRLQYRNRRVNERGHRIKAEARASLIEQRLSGEYQIPRAHPSNEWLSLQAGVRREEVDTFETVETQVGIADTKRRPWGWMERRFVNFNRQAFDISSDSKSSTFVIPGLRWTKAKANDVLFPTRGYSIDFEVRGAADVLLSETNFARALLTTQAVRGLPFRSRLLVRTDFGGMWVDEFTKLPPSERFFAGGDVSIRGFDIDELGPEDAGGDVIGGQYLGVASIELEKSIGERWGVAVFVDAGNAFGGTGASQGIRIGTGAGLRWHSPIGPVRLDIAHPLDDDTLARVHVRIGPDL